jgi:hypothetical protein
VAPSGRLGYVVRMKLRRPRRRSVSLPVMMAELTLASAETIARRMRMMALGTCSPAEYRRMVAEKLTAMQISGRRATRKGASPMALLAPFHQRATANAKRLRRKKV